MTESIGPAPAIADARSHPASPAHQALGLTDVLLFTMAMIWGINFVVVKYATHIFSPVAFTGLRVVTVAIFLLLVVSTRGGIRLPRADVIPLLLLGVLGNGLYQLFFVHGVARTRAGNGALIVGAAPAIVSTDWAHIGLGGWLALFYSSIISMGVAYIFYYRGLRVLGPTRTAVYTNLQPIIALLVAWAFLGENPTVFQGVGAVTIIAGVFLTRA